MEEEQSYSYLLSHEENENNLVNFLNRKSDLLWVKYNFGNLKDSEDLYKVIFRMILEAARYENDIFWKFSWKKMEFYDLENEVLRGANYEVIKSTLANFEKNRSLIMRKAKDHLDENDYSQMLETIFEHFLYCHNKLLYGIVYNTTDCLSFLWGYVTDDEKTAILGCLEVLDIQKLFGILSVKYFLEDQVILQFLKLRCNLDIEYNNNFFLIDKKDEGILSDFLVSCNIREPRKRLDLLWKKTFASEKVEEQRKALLRLFLSPHNKITDWAWEKSVVLKQQTFLLNGANCYVIKHTLEACDLSRLQQFLGEAESHLSRSELVETLKEGIEHIVYWHGRVFDEAVVNNAKALQNALSKFGKLLSLEVIKAIKPATKQKHNLILKYEVFKETPKTWFAHYILTNREEENAFVKFLQTIKCSEQINKESLDLEWNFRGLQKLNSQNLYSALFRAFIFSVGLTNDVILYWILQEIEKAGVEKKVLKEQNYHFVKTVMDLSDSNILNRALKFAGRHLDEEEMHCMYREAYIHAVKWHGTFMCNEVWDSTKSLGTLKKLCSQDQWESIFKISAQDVDEETKRHSDGEIENCKTTKRVRLI